MLVVALEGREGINVREGGGVPYPLDGLPGGHQPHVFHGRDSVQEQLKSLLVMWSCEPGSLKMSMLSFGQPMCWLDVVFCYCLQMIRYKLLRSLKTRPKRIEVTKAFSVTKTDYKLGVNISE